MANAMPVLSPWGMEMIWRILPHASACIAGERIMLLDLRRDRYSQVPATLYPGMAAWLNADTPTPPPPPVLALLQRSGIMGNGDPTPSNASRERVRIPSNLSSPTWDQTSKGSNVVSVAASVITTWMSLRWRPLWSVLIEHQHFDASGRHPSDSNLFNLCARFDRGRRFSPVPRRCLL
ncbi:MAG: hypothetical protein M3Y41_15390, partial [Pseudomonadota bacterium]|nr:hypothetical protein [Pseudomonadota bacterium]